MVKSCREIAEEIDILKRNLQQNKNIKNSYEYFSERRKCNSNTATEMCANCNCWKNVKEYNI
jgi:hypothetical protein